LVEEEIAERRFVAGREAQEDGIALGLVSFLDAVDIERIDA
jgi:hypothetical protein